MAVNERVKSWAKELLAPVLYRHLAPGLHPERLYYYLDTLIRCREVPGDAVEVGVNLGGTAVIASTMLKRLEIARTYRGYDTFGGFVSSQFDQDTERGTPRSYQNDFASTSERLVRRIMSLHGCDDIVLTKCDIVQVDSALLPDTISTALVDVDLSEPTYHALAKIYPKLSASGVILVDDCASQDDKPIWHARDGYLKFVNEAGLPETFKYGMGVIEK